MEMESSRRSIDNNNNRSRELALKKPTTRLVEDVERDRISNGGRSFPSRAVVPSGSAAAAPAVLSRVRAGGGGGNDREREAERVQTQTQQQQQHTYQELVSQYKSALAELTFNSKPIITNLTIIAGENVHAAKWIVGTVCANIIEVPSDQKLPSLYLLDSIVKNIGRDYIKYFAAKLPEVFCKAYRQVDSSIHPGMRHLFGTWKGIFPAPCLQMIDKELGFTPAINGSSSAAPTPKPDPQSQRSAPSIHVNPKYLEARQRLQQSSRAKGTSEDTGTVVAPVDEEMPERTALISRGRPWTDMPAKLHDPRRPLRETLNEPALEKKTSSGDEDNQYGSDIFRHSDLGIRRASERIREGGLEKSWYGAGNAPEAVVSQRTAFNSQHGLLNYRATRTPQANSQLKPTQKIVSRSSGGITESWKNSEEEEFMWDEMRSRLTDHGGPDSSRKDSWTPEDTEMPEFEDGLRQPHGDHDIGSRNKREASTDFLSSTKRKQTAFGHQASSMWPSQDVHTGNGLNHKETPSRFSGLSDSHPTTLSGLTSRSSPLARSGLQTLTGSSVGGGTSSFGSLTNTISGSGGGLGQQRHQPLRPASPSGQGYSPLPLVLRQHQESNNLIKHDQPQSTPSQMLSQLAGQLNRAPHIQNTPESFPIVPQNPSHPGSMRNLQLNQSQTPQNIQTSSPLLSFSHQSKHGNSSHQPHQDLSQAQSSGQNPLPYPSVFGTQVTMGTSSVLSQSGNPASENPGELSRSSLLAAIMNSGMLLNNSVSGGFPNLGFQDSGSLPSQLNVKPPLPTGPPPIATSSPAVVTPVSSSEQTSHGSKSSLLIHPKRKAVPPPLPPGPPPTSSVAGSTSLQTSSQGIAVPNPLSNLLNSLVVKGLISSPAKESPIVTTPLQPSRLQIQNAALATSSSLAVTSSPASSIIPSASSGKELSSLEPAPMSTAALPQIVKPEKKDLIAIEFKPEFIRESHPSVITDLLDDFPHICSICGLRLKLQEQLERHLEWHAAKTSKANSYGLSREWYVKLDDYLAGTVESNSESMSMNVETAVKIEESEQAVSADESQCVCLLCGELFEDFYSHERDEWMYKGAVYMRIPAPEGERGTTNEISAEGLIVHANCISPSSAYDLGLAKNVKLEPMDC